LIPELDLVLWAIKADDRNYASALDTYNNIFNEKISPPVVFVITQTDKTNDTDDWNREENKPGDSQLKNIKTKEIDVLKRFTSTSKPTSLLDLTGGSLFGLNYLAKSKRKNIISIAIKKQKNEGDPPEKYLYNIKSLVELIVEVLPNEKKYSFTREAKEDIVSEQAREGSEKGIFDFVKQLAGEAWDAIKGPVVNAIIASAPKLFKKAGSWLKSLF
jgi:uncharacterized protein